MSRNHSPNRCETCQIFRPLCLCGHAPALELRTEVVIMMHFRELSLTTNTARLAKLALKHSEIRVRGRQNAQVDVFDLVNDPERMPLLLYPSEDSVELSESHREQALQAGKRIVLIVPDGNWRQGSKGAKRTPGLEQVPCVRLPPGPPSEYRLRKAPRPEYVSTYEAIARAIGVLEGREVESTMMSYFRMKIDRMLWARGLLATEKVHGGVPQEAIDSFFIAGSRGSPAGIRDDSEKG
jgi:DTW domain-containing protein YfiP